MGKSNYNVVGLNANKSIVDTLSHIVIMCITHTMQNIVLKVNYRVVCLWFRKHKRAFTPQPTTAVGSYQSWASTAASPKQAAPCVAPTHSSPHHQPRSIEWGLWLQLLLGHFYWICFGNISTTLLYYCTKA